MKFRAHTQSIITIVVAILTTSCVGPTPPSPGCRIQLYILPNLQGNELPIITSTPDLASEWNDVTVSAKVVYGTWRLFENPDYKGFMGDYKAPVDIPQLFPPRKLGSLSCIAPEPVPLPPQY